MTSLQENSKPYAGLDWGLSRIGVSVSPDGIHVFPREPFVVASSEDADRHIASFIHREGIQTVVIGLPLTLAGSEGDMTRAVREAGRRIKEANNVQVQFVDERFSSKEAKDLRKDGSRIPEDSLAAFCILKRFLGV